MPLTLFLAAAGLALVLPLVLTLAVWILALSAAAALLILLSHLPPQGCTGRAAGMPGQNTAPTSRFPDNRLI